MLVLHKLLPLIVSPLGLVVGLLVLSLVFRRRSLIIVALGILLISSLPLTADRIWTELESDYPHQSIESVENADAIVVLSGMLGGIETDDGIISQWGDADRFMTGIDLLKREKAPLIIFTRGQWPWVNLPPEGEILAKRATTMGIDSSRILLTDIVTNTADEADEVKALMSLTGMRSIILVTSAFHMPRAKMLFDRANVKSTPYPTDFRSSGGHIDWMSFVPSAHGFNKTSEGIREFIGRLYYWIGTLAGN